MQETTDPDKSDYVPFRIDTSAPPADTERMTLFWIDDTEYTGPVKIPGSLALRALEETVNRGRAAGAWLCLTETVGEEGIKALLNCPQLTLEQAQDFLSRISAMYYGQAVGVSGK